MGVGVHVDVLVSFGSIAWGSVCVCVGCDSAVGAPWSPGEASGLSEIMESTEIMEGVFERLGETMCPSSLQEDMRFAMR